MVNVSRRSALGALAGTVGLAAIAAPTTAQAAAITGRQLQLYGSGLRTVGGRAARVPGATVAVTGVLAAEPDGEPNGSFVSQATVLGRPSRVRAEAGTVETHTFTLADGSITGSGVLGHDGTGTFAVTGGTGVYLAARGSYTVSLSTDGHAGGAAIFSLDLSA